MDKIKEFVQKYKVPLIAGTFIVLLAGAYFMGRHRATTVVEDQQPVQVSQDLLDNVNALQNKLNTSEQNAKLLQAALEKIQAGKTQPVANYYVTAPTVEKAATIVEKQIAANDPTLPPAALEKTDRTVVTPITKDAAGQVLPTDQQKVDVYKIDLRKDHRIKAGVTVVDSTAYETIGYEQGRVEALAHFSGANFKGGSVMYNVAEW
ncbi:MAG: glycoprotease [Selenomonadaceae bacterium]